MTSSAAICATRRARNPVVLVNSGSIDFIAASSHVRLPRVTTVAETSQTSLVIDVEATAEDPCTRAIHPCTRAQFVLAPAWHASDRPEPARPFGRIPVTVD